MNSQTELVPEPSRMKYKGRGMAIAQMAQSVTDLNLKMKNFNPVCIIFVCFSIIK